MDETTLSTLNSINTLLELGVTPERIAERLDLGIDIICEVNNYDRPDVVGGTIPPEKY